MPSNFTFSQVSVPNGKKGDWIIDEITVNAEELSNWMQNARWIRDGNPELVVPSGTYKRLRHKGRGTIVMSNTPMEILTNQEVYKKATGRVILNGLGLGMVLEGILSKPDVTHVLVVEVDKDLIALVGKHFKKDPRVKIVQADALAYEPPDGEKFDYAWHDIWDQISDENLPEMAALTRKWAKFMSRPGAQGVWARDIALREKRRYG